MCICMTWSVGPYRHGTIPPSPPPPHHTRLNQTTLLLVISKVLKIAQRKTGGAPRQVRGPAPADVQGPAAPQHRARLQGPLGEEGKRKLYTIDYIPLYTFVCMRSIGRGRDARLQAPRLTTPPQPHINIHPQKRAGIPLPEVPFLQERALDQVLPQGRRGPPLPPRQGTSSPSPLILCVHVCVHAVSFLCVDTPICECVDVGGAVEAGPALSPPRQGTLVCVACYWCICGSVVRWMAQLGGITTTTTTTPLRSTQTPRNQSTHTKQAFIFIYKPTLYIPFKDIETVAFDRVGGAVGASVLSSCYMLLRQRLRPSWRRGGMGDGPTLPTPTRPPTVPQTHPTHCPPNPTQPTFQSKQPPPLFLLNQA